MRKIGWLLLGIVLTPVIALAAPGDVFQSQTGILYSGVAGQTESFQKLGTGYATTTGGAGIYLTSGPSTITLYLQECSSSAYNDCISVTDTGSFIATTIDGNQESSSTFSSAYTMLNTKYYRLRWTSGGHRIQCGNTSAQTPNAAGDSTPTDACNAASGRSWTYKLYEGTPPSTNSMTDQVLELIYVILACGIFYLGAVIGYKTTR